MSAVGSAGPIALGLELKKKKYLSADARSSKTSRCGEQRSPQAPRSQVEMRHGLAARLQALRAQKLAQEAGAQAAAPLGPGGGGTARRSNAPLGGPR